VGSEYTLTGAFRATGSTSAQLDIPIVSDQERLGFNVRKFASLSRWNLNGAKEGGAHMWREVWDDDVSLIYRDLGVWRNLSLAARPKWMYMRKSVNPSQVGIRLASQ
jgi:hypothetical protein